MFLSNNPDLGLILQTYSPTGQEDHRKIEYWFRDIQYALDNEGLENALLYLVCASKSIYKREITPDSEDGIKERAQVIVEWRKKEFEEDFFAPPRHIPLTEEEVKQYVEGIKDIEKGRGKK